jgi:hypothetical protein
MLFHKHITENLVVIIVIRFFISLLCIAPTHLVNSVFARPGLNRMTHASLGVGVGPTPFVSLCNQITRCYRVGRKIGIAKIGQPGQECQHGSLAQLDNLTNK